MLDLKLAYARLGLEETATDEELEKRYEVLVRKYRRRSDSEGAQPTAEPSLEEVTEAYNFIKQAAIDAHIKQNESDNKTVERSKHIWEYYRWHIIGSILAVVIVVYFAISVTENRIEQRRIANADLKVTFFTNFNISQADPFEARMLEGFPEWEDLHLMFQYAPLGTESEMDMAMIQKAFIVMSTEKTDLYIIDRGNFEKFGTQGVFLNLDTVPELHDIDPGRRANLVYENSGELWFGVELKGSPLLQEWNLPTDADILAAIRVNTNRMENAIQALHWISNQQR